MAIVMVTVFLTSCEKDYVKVNPNENINEITLQQLKTSKQLWNEKFSDKITLLNYKYVGTVENEQDMQEALNKIADEAKIVASGDLDQPESVKVEVLRENSAKAAITKDNLRNYIKDGIEISNKVIALNWDKNGEQFTTYCIANKEGIVWDNILGGVLAVAPEIEEESGIDSNSNKNGAGWKKWQRRGWKIKAFWGSTIGKLGCTLTIYYNTGGPVTNSDVEDYAWISGGKGVSESKLLVKTGSFAKAQYALAVAGITGKVNFDKGSFTASASGAYDEVRNGTFSLYPN